MTGLLVLLTYAVQLLGYAGIVAGFVILIRAAGEPGTLQRRPPRPYDRRRG